MLIPLLGFRGVLAVQRRQRAGGINHMTPVLSHFFTHHHPCTFAQVSSYMFYTAAGDGRPLKFHMFGANPIAGAHFDGTDFHCWCTVGTYQCLSQSPLT